MNNPENSHMSGRIRTKIALYRERLERDGKRKFGSSPEDVVNWVHRSGGTDHELIDLHERTYPSARKVVWIPGIPGESPQLKIQQKPRATSASPFKLEAEFSQIERVLMEINANPDILSHTSKKSTPRRQELPSAPLRDLSGKAVNKR